MKHIPPGLIMLRPMPIIAAYIVAAFLFGLNVLYALPVAIIVSILFGIARAFQLSVAIGLIVTVYLLLPIFGLQPMPSLVRNWPTESEFDRRVKEKFPVGTPESSLIRELHWWQGFSAEQGAKSMKRVDGRSLCGYRWYVTWKVDDTGNVAEVMGQVSRTCV